MSGNTSEKNITKRSSGTASERVVTPFTAIDLFAGCGGLSYGLRRAKFNIVGALEIDSVAAAAYRLNHEKTPLKESDIR
ncbi:MAG TPA: DNA cytosine methyltransferase, partial [Methylothermaceae bacterium]|nr:DNA cytosine methyltransferase [Methylothermaceae bacterium]